MSADRKIKVNIIHAAVFFLWCKTYLAYKYSFELSGENLMQEYILILNPLSFLMIGAGIGLFLTGRKRNYFVLIFHAFISVVLYANVVYYREFFDFITIPLLMQRSNFADLGTSIRELVNLTDIFYFLDTVFLAYLVVRKPVLLSLEGYSRPQKTAFYYIAAALAFLNLSLAETQRSELLTRTFDREILVKNIGTYHYHIYDAFLHTKAKAQRAMADGDELSDIENFTQARYKKPTATLFGIGKGKNLIVVSLESTQSFVIGQKVNEQEITPFLNDFKEESFYFDEFYHQTGQGKTSDSEFLLDNSLYPLSRGAVFFTHADNRYYSMNEKLKEKGYFTATLHANNKSFWNRDVMYGNLKYDRFYSLLDYQVTAQNSVGWGMKDIDFFYQSVQHMKQMPRPFYTKFITLTNHFPFELKPEDQLIDEYHSVSGTLNRYFPTVRYTDEAIKLFIEDLKKEGLYEDSILVLYGDHYGISENHHEAMGQFLGKEITPYENIRLQRVPLFIHIPGIKGGTISSISGQVDLRPTLLHLLGIETKEDIQFGTDLFSKQRDQFTVLRDGSFISNDFIFTGGNCYQKDTGIVIEKASCEPIIEQAKQELEYSDQIIYGDLLRFYQK
ncbi:LTA synthase family protein [Bacillus sp. V33-4]|uniref:LTA synthase family protein n=1 Tax=Bacillus sp. V33-4 TaxID=2054169 RepID=UPI00215576F9|nr:LTA synthase family protein [Bacillus sp. V33-4]